MRSSGVRPARQYDEHDLQRTSGVTTCDSPVRNGRYVTIAAFDDPHAGQTRFAGVRTEVTGFS
jgi:hypothetical protein